MSQHISGLEHSQEDLYIYSHSPAEDFDEHVWYHVSDYFEKVYLVTNTPNSGTTKNRTAQALGIPVITEAELLAMLKN